MTESIKGDKGAWIICKCPRCEKLHKKFVFYTGRSKLPRFLCTECARGTDLRWLQRKEQDEWTFEE